MDDPFYSDQALQCIHAGVDARPEVVALLKNIKETLPQLQALLEKYDACHFEDFLYRLYHHSFKVYGIQSATKEIVQALKSLAPDRALNEDFETIFNEGTNKRFELEHNHRWLAETRPLVEAFFHARYFLEVAVRYGQTLHHPPQMLPGGWAALLYLFRLR
jgi:hypothetical protein